MTVRARVLLGFAAFTLLMVLQALLVFELHRETLRLRNDAAATDERIGLLDETAKTLLHMVAAARGYAISGDRRMREAYDADERHYVSLRSDLRPLLAPAAQAQFAAIDALATDWMRNGSSRLIAARDRGGDVSAVLTHEAEPRFAKITPALAIMAEREDLEQEQRQDEIERHLNRASWLLMTIPLVTLLMLLGLAVFVLVRILDPVTVLSQSVHRVARGDFSTSLPAGRRDEIGALSDAFMHMSAAVQRRERDLSEALGRERASTDAASHLKSEVERQHAQLLATLETVPAALVILGPDGTIATQNKAAEALLGREPADPQERLDYWKQFFVMDRQGRPIRPREWAPISAMMGNTVIAQELSIRRPTGDVVPIVVSAAPLRDEAGRITGAVSAFQDVTPLLEVEQMKNDFVSVVSHELRTPLTSIRGGLQLVLGDEAVTDPDHRQLLTVALNNADRLIRIVNDILDMSKIEAGRLPLDKRPCRVEELLRVALQSVERIAAGASVRLEARLAPDLWPVLADFDRMVQVLVNLLSNAIKFAPSDTAVTIEGENGANGQVSIAIRDRGVGISRDNLVRLFQKFEQVDSSPSRRVGGTGLGLAITKALVEQHGGHIHVQSAEGQGSTFTLTVPAADASYGTLAMPTASASGAATADDAACPRSRVLLAEDDEGLLIVMMQALTRSGLDVMLARNGHDAWTMATQTQPPDLVVLDLAMPQMDGFEVIRRIRATARSHDVPIVAISGSDRAGPSETRARALGANLFLAKPLDANGLVRDVQRLLIATSPGTRP